MKKYVLAILMIALTTLGGRAQTDALVIEHHNGLADIYPVSADLHIINESDGDSVYVVMADSIMASYARTDVRRMVFDDEAFLTDSVERAALVALYKATDGNHWRNDYDPEWNNSNWCTERPVSEWAGVEKVGNGHVQFLDLGSRHLSGEIPIELYNLKGLNRLDLGNNELKGTISSAICRLRNLVSLDFDGNRLSGELPKEIGNLESLEELSLGINILTGNIPHELENLSNLKIISLANNNLTGTIPEWLGNMKNLQSLYLAGNQLEGPIPAELGQLANLTNLRLYNNKLTGEIPSELGNLIKLRELDVCGNSLEGQIPESISNLKNLVRSRGNGYYNFFLYTYSNNLSGKIPSLFYNHPAWPYKWSQIIGGNPMYSLDELYVPAPSFRVTDIDGNVLDSKEIYPNNTYTAIYHWTSWTPTVGLVNEMVRLYHKYRDSGFEVIGLTQGESEETIRNYIAEHNIPWHNYISTPDNRLDYGDNYYGYPRGVTPEISLIDSEGRLVFTSELTSYNNMAAFLAEKLGEGKPDEVAYTSTDYSTDGRVETLQAASSENDIKVVIMGDGYSDRLIADGTYGKAMNRAMEAFFTTEPVRSYRDRFTVKSVVAVSQNEVFSDSTHTAFEGRIADYLGGNASTVFRYAQKAVSEEDMDDAVIIVVMNSEKFRRPGTCAMYMPEKSNAWGSGAAIAYIADFSGNGGEFNVTSFETVLSHEAVGHGFAKLEDEYVSGDETFTDSEGYADRIACGWWKNIDITDDADAVKWSEFITDERYANEQIGIYEGGMTYFRYGVYRSTQTSLMGSNAIRFNAPSRKAIWYRINKLTEGEAWEGSHEDFVLFDQQSSSNSPKAKPVPQKVHAAPLYESAPPIIKSITWRMER